MERAARTAKLWAKRATGNLSAKKEAERQLQQNAAKQRLKQAMSIISTLYHTHDEDKKAFSDDGNISNGSLAAERCMDGPSVGSAAATSAIQGRGKGLGAGGMWETTLPQMMAFYARHDPTKTRVAVVEIMGAWCEADMLRGLQRQRQRRRRRWQQWRRR